MLLEKLSKQTGRSAEQLLAFAASAGRRYKVYPVKKRSGGERIIEQPAKPVKAVQRWLIKSLFGFYPQHDCALGYRAGLSVRDNAIRHAGYSYTLRLDFLNFFWSFQTADIRSFLEDNKLTSLSLTKNDIEFVSNVISRNGRLVMGAPSSPIVTNIIMKNIDQQISEICKEFCAVYTRYADDIFISSNISSSSKFLEERVIRIVEMCDSPKLTLNSKKTVHLSKKYHREVTGLVLTTDGRVSIGRARKRMIKAQVHQSRLANVGAIDRQRLAGYLNWAADADEDFLRSLEKKYGVELISKLKRGI